MDYFRGGCQGRQQRVGHGTLSAASIRGQTRQTIVVVLEEWSELRHVSHFTLGNVDVKEV